MTQPESTRKPWLIAILALAIIAMLVFLATGLLVIGADSLSDPDDTLGEELNTLKSQVKEFESAPSATERPEPTQISPNSGNIHPRSGGLISSCIGMEAVED